MNNKMSLGDAIQTISYNPFFLSELIMTTFYGYKQKKITFFDVYLVLPMLLFEKSMIALQSTNSSGTIYSVFLRNKNISAISGLESRIKKMKKITNLALQVSLQNDWITFDPQNFNIIINSKFKTQFENNRSIKKGIYNSAYNLGKILTKQNSKDNYLLLGVKEI